MFSKSLISNETESVGSFVGGGISNVEDSDCNIKKTIQKNHNSCLVANGKSLTSKNNNLYFEPSQFYFISTLTTFLCLMLIINLFCEYHIRLCDYHILHEIM